MASIGFILFTLLVEINVMTRAIIMVKINMPIGTRGLLIIPFKE